MRRSPRAVILIGLCAAAALVRCSCDDSETAKQVPNRDAAADADAKSEADGEAGMLALGPVSCDALAPLPDWAEQLAEHRVTAHCDELALALEAYADATLRLRYAPVQTSIPDRSWTMDTLPPAAASVTSGLSDSGALVVCSDAFAVAVAPGSCQIRVEDRSQHVLLEDGTTGGWKNDSPGARLERLTPSAERFYGFGERTGALDKRGKKLVFWNTDAYRSDLGGWASDQDPLYQSIPFFIGLRDRIAYGVFTDVAYRLELDMAQSYAGRYVVRASGGALDQWIFAGPAMRDVVRRATALTGRAPLPPRWALGFHQSRWGYSPESAFVKIGDELRARKIPADALWLDIQHMDGFRTFTWDGASFPDPANMIASLAANGFSVVAIADPGLKVDAAWAAYQAGISGNHFLKQPDGSVYEGVVWPGSAAFPDFSRAQTRAWWSELAANFVASGLRGLWLDVNEPTTFPESGGATIPDDVIADGDGTPTTMAELHNVYGLLESRATFEGMKKAFPDRRPFILSRAGYAGIQRSAAVWTGDAPSTFDSLATTLPMLLGMGLSGVPFVGSDVGGYSGNASPELYARWMALGSICPFFRAHVTNGVPGQEPWMFGPEVEALSRGLIGERYRLLPYLYSLMAEAEQSGAPPLRPLIYEFQSEAALETIGDQALLGPFLMFAPVVTAAATTRSVVLPKGRWMELHSGAVLDGPTTIDVGLTLAALPAFVRAGAILPRGDVMQWTGEKPLDPLYLDLYPSAEQSQFVLTEDAGDGYGGFRKRDYRLSQKPDGMELISEKLEGSFETAPRRLLIRVRRVDKPVAKVALDQVPLAEHASLADLPSAGQGWFSDTNDRSLVILFSDRDAFTLRAFYDPALDDLKPPVRVALEVEVPAGTPAGATIHVATSTNGWTQTAMTWTATPNVARVEIDVPRGEWFFYKYTRGDWSSVEKWAGCIEADNRYAFGSAFSEPHDTVAVWADACP